MGMRKLARCKRGLHELSGFNAIHKADGARECRACKYQTTNARNRRNRRKNRAAGRPPLTT